MLAKFSSWRVALSTGLVITGVNVVVLQVGSLLGADMLVAPSAASDPFEVGLVSVVLMSFAPTVLGGLALQLVGQRSTRLWRGVGWLGLALGVLTVPMPFTVLATTGTAVTLGTMHLVAGLVWLAAVRRADPRLRERSARPQPHPA